MAYAIVWKPAWSFGFEFDKVNGQFVALYWPNVPAEVGYSFLPNSICQNLISGADMIRLYFQVRTTNNCARDYSNAIILTDSFSPASVIPKEDEDFFLIPVHKK
jgi:hypothetical protein